MELRAFFNSRTRPHVNVLQNQSVGDVLNLAVYRLRCKHYFCHLTCPPSQRQTMLPAGGRQHRVCIIPQAVTHSLVLLKMGKIIARNLLS